MPLSSGVCPSLSRRPRAMDPSAATRAGIQQHSMQMHPYFVSSGPPVRSSRILHARLSQCSRIQTARPQRQACGRVKSSPSDEAEGATASEGAEKLQTEQAQPVSSSGKDEDRSLRRARSSRKEEEDGQFRIDQLNPYSMGRKSRCYACPHS